MKTSISKSSLAEAGVHTGVITMPRVREPVLKRPLDVFLSTFMLIISIPVSSLIALAIKLEDGGSILYRQERWGRNGSHFRAYKFRTMVGNSDQEFGIKQAKENDPRISRVGQILRSTGLDEHPQLFHIFRGEMSFVGPRSLAAGEIVQDEKGRMVSYENVGGFCFLAFDLSFLASNCFSDLLSAFLFKQGSNLHHKGMAF